jgi:hypothetical protein
MRKLDKETSHHAYIVAVDNHLHPPALLHAPFTLLFPDPFLAIYFYKVKEKKKHKTHLDKRN